MLEYIEAILNIHRYVFKTWLLAVHWVIEGREPKL
jgi:hypothetical protein